MHFRYRSLLIPALLALCVAMPLVRGFAEHREHAGEAEDAEARDAPSDYFFRQRALPDGTIPTERIVAATEHLLFERALAEQQLGVSSAQDWTPIGPYTIGGRVNAIVAAPGGSPAYLGAANGGVWRSDDWGTNWAPLTDKLGIFSVGTLALNPLNKNSLWCGTGDADATVDGYDGTGLFQSRDKGVNWTYRGLREVAHIAAVAVDPGDTNRIYVGAMGKAFTTDSNRGFYRSLNGGSTWTRTLFVNDSTGVSEVVVNPVHPDTMFCTTWERVRRLKYRRAYGAGCGIWRSVDRGATWTRLTNGLPAAGENLGRIALAIAPSWPSRLYATPISGAISGYIGLGVYRSDDGGESWARMDETNVEPNAFGGFGWYFGHLAVAPNDPDDVWICGVDLLHSTDAGVIPVSALNGAHVDQHAVWIDPADPSRVYLGNDGGFYSLVGGQWIKSTNLPISQFYAGTVAPQDANKVLGGTQDNGTLKSELGTPDWTRILGGDGFTPLVSAVNVNHILAEWQYCSDKSGFKRSTNNGVAFSATSGWVNSDRFNWNTPLAMSPNNPNTLLSGSHRVYRTLNTGVSWTPISGDLSTNPGALVNYGTITSVAISKADSNLYLAGTDDGKVWRSQNAGGVWQDITPGLPALYVTRVVTDPADPQVVYVAHSGFGQDQHDPRVFRSTDRGDTWQPISGNLPDAPVNDLIVDPLLPATLYAATDLGVFETRNLGQTWVPLGGYMPIQPVWDLELHQATRQLFAFTHGRSAWKLDLNTISLSAPRSTSSSGLALSAPAPNPSRGAFRFELVLGARAQVEVNVFDALGRRIRALARGARDAGRFPLAWDARDDRGARVSPGVFFVRASDGSNTRTHRIVLTN
jgi:photosystem II stability/assembly factor-like uncharacterized protein